MKSKDSLETLYFMATLLCTHQAIDVIVIGYDDDDDDAIT
jgi:hypothetical protein